MCLQGRAEEAIATIDGYVHRIQARFANPSAKVNTGENERLIQGLPEFVRVASAIGTRDGEKERKARLDYVRAKWERKKTESAEAELHRKGRDILRYINWQCERPLGADQYNELLGLLVNKDFVGFGRELGELKRREQISEEVRKSLGSISNLNALHTKVCDCVLAELDHLAENEPEKLAEHIGLVPREKKEGPSYEEKVKAFIEQPMIYKGFLRATFFNGAGKTFAKLVEEAFQKRAYPDVPLGQEYYHVSSLGRFDKDNSVLYETLARDRLCVMMGRMCYEQLNRVLQGKAQRVSWEKKGGRETICLEIARQDKPGETFQIRFAVTDYAKLYVMDDAEFLGGLMSHFFQRERSIDYHRLYSDGINKYTAMQRDAIAPILRLEERVIKQKSIPTSAQGYIEFSEIIEASDYQPHEKEVLKRVRNNLLHYLLKFEPSHYSKFTEIMRRGGLDIKKNRKAAKKVPVHDFLSA